MSEKQLIALIDDLEKALIGAKETIRVWHGMGSLDEKQQNSMWEIYDNQSPDMRPINWVLEKVRLLREFDLLGE